MSKKTEADKRKGAKTGTATKKQVLDDAMLDSVTGGFVRSWCGQAGPRCTTWQSVTSQPRGLPERTS